MAELSGQRVARRPWLAVLVVAATSSGLVACGGGSGSPQVASLASSSGHRGSATTSRRSITSTSPKGNPTKLVDEWAACERRHGDPSQADPIIDAHGVINITTPPPGSGAPPAGDPHSAMGTCSRYLAAAQRALRAADPVPDPLGMTNQSDLLKYVNCMRTSGVPKYPYPTGNSTNFNGTGVDPNSPSVVKISIRCGNKLGLPLWWSAGWGPPGDVTVSTPDPPGAPPRGAPVPATGSNGGRPPGAAMPGGSGPNG